MLLQSEEKQKLLFYILTIFDSSVFSFLTNRQGLPGVNKLCFCTLSFFSLETSQSIDLAQAAFDSPCIDVRPHQCSSMKSEHTDLFLPHFNLENIGRKRDGGNKSFFFLQRVTTQIFGVAATAAATNSSFLFRFSSPASPLGLTWPWQVQQHKEASGREEGGQQTRIKKWEVWPNCGDNLAFKGRAEGSCITVVYGCTWNGELAE